jgi:hypothetical protein
MHSCCGSSIGDLNKTKIAYKGKLVPRQAMEALEGRGYIAHTLS